MNAITRDMYAGLASQLNQAAEDPAIRCVLITSEGDHFTAGNDIRDFMSNPPTEKDSVVAKFLGSLLEFPKPLLAAVKGNAIGVGTTMLLHCDVVVASPTANFSMPFTSLLEASISRYMEEMYIQNRLKPVDKLFIVVEDLTTESYVVSIRPRQSVKSASTIKVAILHAFMIQRFRGNIKEPSKYERQIEEMIRFSSNPSSKRSYIALLAPTKRCFCNFLCI